MFPTNRIQEDLEDEMWINQLQKIIIILLLLMMFVGYCSLSKRNSKEIQRYANSLEALSDSFKVHKTKTDTFWAIQTIQLTPDEIKQTPQYKSLSEEKKRLIEELSDTKNLLASVQFQLDGTILDSQQFFIDTTETLDTLVFSDTTGSFKYEETLRFHKDSVSRVFKGLLELSPEVKIIKLKHGEVETQIRIPSDDISINLRGGMSFYLRETKQEKRKRKIIKGLKYTGLGVGAILLGTAGFKLGQNF